MIRYLFQAIFFTSLLLGFTVDGFSSSTSETAVSTGNISAFASLQAYDWALIGFAAILLFIIILLTNTLSLAMRVSTKNEQSAVKKSGIIPVVLLGSLSLLVPNDVMAAGGLIPDTFNFFRAILYIIIGLELVIIYVLVNWIKIFAGIKAGVMSRVSGDDDWSFARIWTKINKLRPIEEEGEIETDHDYDGIKELDNATPPWFTVSFIASIIFAAFYMYRYHVAYSAPNQIEEYKISVAEARAAQMEFLAGQANLVDESSVVMLDEAGIATGKILYSGNCVACHGAEGQGGVGPNLTDDYWLHGGSIKDVFKVIKYGVVENGMKSWKDDFSASQIAQIASFVKSLNGTNPAGAKEKQGEYYDPNTVEEESGQPAADDAQTEN